MKLSRTFAFKWIVLALVPPTIGLGWALSDRWLPRVQAQLGLVQADDHDDHNHAAREAGAENAIELSPQARRNIGLRTGEVTPRDYARSITVPAMVVGHPEHTNVKISAPLSGVVVGVYVIDGQAVRSGDLLFRIRLTHQDLVQAQIDFLRALNQLDVEKRELKRLKSIASGAVAGKVILQHEYARDKLMADLQAQREGLLLHGLSEAQVDHIARERKLVRELRIYAPQLHEDASIHDDSEKPHPHSQSAASLASANSAEAAPAHGSPEPRQFVVSSVVARKGQGVAVSDLLCVLSDLSDLYAEGRAFEQDADELARAATRKHNVTALLELGESDPDAAYLKDRELPQKADGLTQAPPQEDGAPALLEGGGFPARVVEDLSIAYVVNKIDPQSRALRFFVALPNQIMADEQFEGRRFVTWRFKPGQRMQLLVPVERWENVIVLPVEAVAAAGPETYVFVANGKQFQRRPVHVHYRDQRNVVIANDGSLFPGEVVALNGAHQLQMAIKNKSGGGAAGHGHSHMH